MGLLDYHLNEFEIVDPSTGVKTNIGIPDEEFLEAVKDPITSNTKRCWNGLVVNLIQNISI